MKRFVEISLASMLAFTALITVSCNKKKDTIANIYVVDEDNNRVPGARVVLKGVSTVEPAPPVTLYDTVMANSSGVATFNFNDEYQKGQAGVAVLNIEVSSGNKSGEGIIKIVEEETVEETVFIQ